MSGAVWIFALGAGLIGWAYVGYPLWCFVRARLLPRPIKRAPVRPRVTVIIAAWREAKTIGQKLESLANQTYPQGLVDVVVACDGSDDGTQGAATDAGAKALAGRVKVLDLPRGGKPTALNAGAAAAAGEVLVFTDARQPLSENAIEALVEDLADETVGAVGGELVMDGAEPAGAYWKYEAFIRRCEGRSGSTVGVSGALYAIRRELFAPMPPETILDDVYVPMRVRLAGRRVGFEPAARAFDRAAHSGREFQRKVRTLSGNFQLLLLLPRVLVPLVNPSFGDFVSHKLLRLAVPFAAIATLVTSPFLPAPYGPILFGGQLAGYSLVAGRAIGLLRGSRLAGLAETFVVLNAAVVVGLARFVRYGRRLPW